MEGVHEVNDWFFFFPKQSVIVKTNKVSIALGDILEDAGDFSRL